MGELLILTFACAVIYWAVKQYKSAKVHPASAVKERSEIQQRVRLTDEQISCLSSASSGKTIYGETPKFKFAQMPHGGFAYDLRTVNSLVKRGYLQPNGKGGYVKTESTDRALRSATGF